MRGFKRYFYHEAHEEHEGKTREVCWFLHDLHALHGNPLLVVER